MTALPLPARNTQHAARATVWGDVLGAVLPPFLVSRVFIGVLALILTDRLATGALPLQGAVHPGVLSPLTNAWDAGWYISIARDGYDPSPTPGVQHNYAFFPLFPLLMRLLVGADHPPSDYGLVGVALSHLALFGALVIIYRLTVAVFRENRAMARIWGRRTIWIMAVAPWAFVFSMAYTESLFLLLSAGAMWYAWRASYERALTRRSGLWMVLALACLIGATLTRVPGVLISVGVAWMFARRLVAPTRLQQVALIAFPLVVAGAAFIAFIAYIGLRTGDVGAALTARWGWGEGFLTDLGQRLDLHKGDALTWAYAVVQLGALAGWIALTVGVWRVPWGTERTGAPHADSPAPALMPGFGGFQLYALALLGTLVQVPVVLALARYALASFPCAWVLARLTLPRWLGVGLLALSLALQGGCFWLATTVAWPP